MNNPRFANVELTPETIQRTREHFRDIHLACIRDAEDGTTRVNDLPGYVSWQQAAIADVMNTERFSVTFLQRAHWLQTGECIALLP
jgi:hypothetical protein